MHTLPQLPYSYNALEPYIDELTMRIHHTKHHQGYVDNLNKILETRPELSKLSIEELLMNVETLPLDIRQGIINFAGGHANHSFFWEIMTPQKTKPGEKTQEVINKKFGSIEKFKEEFTTKAMGVFGSGWAFFIATPGKDFLLKRHSFQNSPLMRGNTPILGIDVWEHAYYLKYQNRKAEYVEAWWNVVNWKKVEENIIKVLSK